MESVLSKITVDKSTEQLEQVLQATLEEYGIAVIPEYYNAEVVDQLSTEFQTVLSSTTNAFIAPFDYSMGKGAKVLWHKVEEGQLPATCKTFGDPFMNDIAKTYLKDAFKLNEEIYVVKDVVGSKHHANDLHFDISRSFKFFIYLKDTTSTNGAFDCVPGSHKITLQLREKYGANLSYETRELSRDLPVKEGDTIAIEGKAGTLIIFDTDVFHRAGTVSEGERWVMRGHNRIDKDRIEASAAKPVTPSFGSKVKNKLGKLFNG